MVLQVVKTINQNIQANYKLFYQYHPKRSILGKTR